MKIDTKNKKVMVLISILIIFICVVMLIKYGDKTVDKELLKSNLEMINTECNSIYENIDIAEDQYKELLKTEEDPFKRGMYSSVLVQYFASKNDYEELCKYSQEAIENYNKVENGEYYSIAEQKYLAWIMLKLGKYADCFKVTNQLLDVINSKGEYLLTREEIIDSEVIIYSIFTAIYSEFNVLDKAEIYYNKLCKIDIPTQVQESKGDRIAYSKMLYADKINDAELRKQYADECYNISLKRDELNSIEIADSVILNVGIANTKLGNFEEALEEIKKAEVFYKKVGDTEGLANAYVAYAEYYNQFNENDLVQKYYKEGIDLYIKSKDYYSLKVTIGGFIKFLEGNNIKNDINQYYELYYYISNELGGDKGLNELLVEITNTNDELNNIRVGLLEKETENNQKIIVVAIIVISLLVLMMVRMHYLIEKKDESEKRLEEMVNTDYLTEINTRAYGERLILSEVNKNEKITIAIIDIDNFKNINDTYGHLVGDVLLKRIANELKQNIAENDIILRFGGEEFVVAFIGKDKNEAKEKLDKIRTDLNNMIFENNIKISFSAGMQEWDGSSINLVIKKADELLYKAKREGKNRVLN